MGTADRARINKNISRGQARTWSDPLRRLQRAIRTARNEAGRFRAESPSLTANEIMARLDECLKFAELAKEAT